MKKYGYFIGGLSGLFWGVISILYGYIDTENQNKILNIMLPFTIDLLGFIVSGGYVLYKYRSKFKLHKSIFLGILSGIIGGPLGMLSYIYAIQNIGAEYSAAISSTYPILCTLFFVFAKKEAIGKWRIGGILMVSICSILLGCVGSSSLNYEGGAMLWLAVLTSVCWSTEVILSSQAMKYYNGTIIYFARQLGSTIGYSLLMMYHLPMDFLQVEWKPLIMFGIIVFSILSYFLYYQAIYFISPISALALNITYNIWTILFTIILSGDVHYVSILLCIGISLGSLLTIIKQDEK